MSEHPKTPDAIVGLATLGCSITGVASLIVATFPLFARESLAASVFLTAAALSFGLLADALLRE